MLLQQILVTLDAELVRLAKLREIVASLATSPSTNVPAPSEKTLATNLSASAEAPVQLTRLPPSRRGQKRTRTVQRTPGAPQPVALSGSIPKGPVVVSADALKRENVSRQRSQPQPISPQETGTLGAMIKALQLRTAI